jgi:hypothetical protein
MPTAIGHGSCSTEVNGMRGAVRPRPLRRQAGMRSATVAGQSRGRCIVAGSAEGIQRDPPITREADGSSDANPMAAKGMCVRRETGVRINATTFSDRVARSDAGNQRAGRRAETQLSQRHLCSGVIDKYSDTRLLKTSTSPFISK